MNLLKIKQHIARIINDSRLRLYRRAIILIQIVMSCPLCNCEKVTKGRCFNCGFPSSLYQKASKISDSQRDIFRWIDIFDEDVSFLNNNGFILSSEFENLKNRYNDKYETIKSTRTLLHNKKKNEFIKTYENLDNIRESHNMSYIDHVIEKDKDYLDHILDAIDPNIVLDKDQRIAAVTDDDNCLIIAGAGSGKTTTVAAKVKYLTDKVGIPPQEILVISFTNKAVNELKGRINKDLKIPAEITTFHSFANRLIMKVDKKPTSIISGMEQWDIFNNILTDKIYHDRALLGKLVLFMGQYFNFPEEALERYRTFDDYCRYLSLNKFESLKNELDDYLQSKDMLKKTDIPSVFAIKDGPKVRFASEIKKEYDASIFKHFILLFKLIDKLTETSVQYITD